MLPVQHLDPQDKWGIDAAAAAAVVGTLIGWLPAIAAALGIVWYGMLMYAWIVNKNWKPK